MTNVKGEELRLINHLRSIAGDSGLISYKTFINEVLFAPEMGYYTKERRRVGRGPETDFYTAESLGPVFRKLVLAAIKKLLGDEDCGQYIFVEIGAEPGAGLLGEGDVRHYGFQDVKVIRPGEAIEIPSKAVLFANELLDAQPFHRLVFKNGHWRELGVRIGSHSDALSEDFLPELSSGVKERLEKADLSDDVDEGYQLDLPLGAEGLLESITRQDWNGLIILFDYGFSWEDLIHNHPQGTARAYYKHKQHNDLLANISNQDITCHICWDPLTDILKTHRFKDITLQRQESFFVHNASAAIEEIINTKPGKSDMRTEFNYDKQTLQELIYPGHMGHKFQVLWARR